MIELMKIEIRFELFKHYTVDGVIEHIYLL
jgi:hypothetical protein